MGPSRTGHSLRVQSHGSQRVQRALVSERAGMSPASGTWGILCWRQWARRATWSGLATGEGMRRRTGRTLPRSSIPSGSRVNARWFVTMSGVASLFARTSGSQPVAFAASPLVPSNYPMAPSFGRKGWSITSMSIKSDFRIALPSTYGVRSNSLTQPWSMRTGGGVNAPRANRWPRGRGVRPRQGPSACGNVTGYHVPA